MNKSQAKPSRDGFISLEEHLTEEVEQLDRVSPGWREPSRVANAKLQLLRGVKREAVEAIFGTETCAQADREITLESMK